MSDMVHAKLGDKIEILFDGGRERLRLELPEGSGVGIKYSSEDRFRISDKLKCARIMQDEEQFVRPIRREDWDDEPLFDETVVAETDDRAPAFKGTLSVCERLGVPFDTQIEVGVEADKVSIVTVYGDEMRERTIALHEHATEAAKIARVASVLECCLHEVAFRHVEVDYHECERIAAIALVRVGGQH